MVPSFCAFQQRVKVPGEVPVGTASIPVAVLDSTISLVLPECQHPTNRASVACSPICAGVDGDGSGLALFSNDCVGGGEGGAADTNLSVGAVFATSAGDGCGVGLSLPMRDRHRQAVEESSRIAASARAKNPARESANHPRRLSFPPSSRVRR